VGYTTKELNTQTSSILNIALSESISDINEVVVTALGVKRDKKSIGYAVQ
jgi:hypothetical protein